MHSCAKRVRCYTITLQGYWGRLEIKLMHVKSLGTAFQNFKMLCCACLKQDLMHAHRFVKQFGHIYWTFSIWFPPKQLDWVKIGRLDRQLHYRQHCLFPPQISLAQTKKPSYPQVFDEQSGSLVSNLLFPPSVCITNTLTCKHFQYASGYVNVPTGVWSKVG